METKHGHHIALTWPPSFRYKLECDLLDQNGCSGHGNWPWLSKQRDVITHGHYGALWASPINLWEMEQAEAAEQNTFFSTSESERGNTREGETTVTVEHLPLGSTFSCQANPSTHMHVHAHSYCSADDNSGWRGSEKWWGRCLWRPFGTISMAFACKMFLGKVVCTSISVT